MKSIALLIFLSVLMCAETIDCTQIFEGRKTELLKEVEKIDEARQSFEALQAATNALFEKQRSAIKEKEDAIAKTKQAIDVKEKSIALMLEENKKLLELIDSKKNGKIDETYLKMKDASAAAILEKLPLHEAAAIIFSLPAKKISLIFAKMDVQKASEITQRLRQGPPFIDLNQSK